MSKKPTIARGRVHLHDGTELDVEMRLTRKDVSIRTDRLELGVWPRASVYVTRTSRRSFDVETNGDVVTFYPENAHEFAALRFGSRRRQGPAHARPGGLRGRLARPVRRRPAPVPDDEAPTDVEVVPEAASPEKAKDTRPPWLRRRRPRPVLVDSVSETVEAEPVKPPKAKPWSQSVTWTMIRRAGRGLRRLWLRIVNRLRSSGIRVADRLPMVSDEQLTSPNHRHVYRAHLVGAGLVRHVCGDCGHVSISSNEAEVGE